MIRRGQHKKRKTRKARESARRELASGQGTYRTPDRAEFGADDWYFYADENETIRVHTYVWRRGGLLVDFAILFFALGPDGEEEVERIDCEHGHCHHHQRNSECEGLMRLDDVYDVQSAFGLSEGIIQNRVRILLERLEREER